MTSATRHEHGRPGQQGQHRLGGALADALGRRATLTTGMLANGAALITLGYMTAAPAVIAATFAAGATVDIYRPAAQALVADLIPAASRPRAYGLISWAANLGFSAAMLAGGMLAQAGFRWLFWADAATCTAFAVLAWRAIPAAHAHPQARRSKPSGLGSVLRDRVMAAFALLALGYTAVYQQAFTTLPIAMHQRGLPPRAYGLVMALNGTVIVIIQPLAGQPRPQPGRRSRPHPHRRRVRRHRSGLDRPGLRRRSLHLDTRRDRHGHGRRGHRRRPGTSAPPRPVPGTLRRRRSPRRAARPARRKPAAPPRRPRPVARVRRPHGGHRTRPGHPRPSHPQPDPPRSHRTNLAQAPQSCSRLQGAPASQAGTPCGPLRERHIAGTEGSTPQ
jgi:Major Facilitator Superfamily